MLIYPISNFYIIITFYLKKTTDVVTPGLGVILGNPHTITVERTIAYE